MADPQLIYFADPMCSWCYGFQPVMARVQARFGGQVGIRVVMGGLRPGTDKPMANAAKNELSNHWMEVHEATGQPFDYDVLDLPGFIYDTDPGARAVVVVRDLMPERALDFLGRLQSAFYAERQDLTRPEVLAALAGEFGIDREVFLGRWDTDEAKNATWSDYALSQRAGVKGFPTLVAGPNDQGVFGAVTRGYSPPDHVLGILENWLAARAA